ncbi:MAG: tetratricopeptide repeat protein [Bacteroidota bacterium]
MESVAWISERKDVLYAGFYLLTLLSYLEFTAKSGLKWYLLSLFIFLLACLSKGQAVTLGVSLILVDIFLGRKWASLKVLIEKVPFLIIAFVFGVVAIKAQAGADATIMANFPIQQRFAFASYGLVMYILKLLIPFKLSAYYPYPIISDVGEVPLVYWLCIIPAIVLFVGWIISYKRSKPVFFGIGFFLVNIVFLLQLLPVGRAIMADRYVYIPSIGYCFLIGWYLNDFKYINSRVTAFIIIIPYVALLGFLTFQRSQVWKNSVILWSDVLEKNSQVTIAWYNRGNLCMDSADYHGAISDYTECLNVDNKYWKAYINRGNAKNELKNHIGAIEDFNAVLRLDSSSLRAYVNRAMSFQKLLDYNNSLKDFNKALSLKPEQVEIYTSRANLKFEMKDYQGAISDLTEGLRINPKYVVGYLNRAIIKKNTKDLKGAIEDYNKAIELDPKNSDIINNRGNLQFQIGDTSSACKDYSESIRISPEQYLGYKNRGALKFSMEKFDDALADYNIAIRLNPSSGELHYNLALVKQKKNDQAATLSEYKKAVELDPIYASDEFRQKLGIKSNEIEGFQPSQFNEQGKAMESKGNLQEALTLYKKAVELKPEFAEAWYNLGNIYGKTGKYADAMQCMDNAIRFKKDYAEALSSRGIAYASMGKVNEALNDLSSSIKANPKCAAAYYNRAIVYLTNGNRESACTDLNKAIELGYTAAYQIYQKECQKK